MVVKKHLIEDLLKQLDTILEELSKYKVDRRRTSRAR
jgi:hypothetical protein